MNFTYDNYMRSDNGGKDFILRTLFETVAEQQKQIATMKQEITQLKETRQPLNRLAKGHQSWLPRMGGNDAS